MARTRTQLRQAIAKETGLNVYKTGTSDSSGSTTTTLVDTPLLQLYPDDYFIGAYVYLTASAADLRVTDSDQSGGSLTFVPAQASAPDSLAYEILPFESGVIHTALAQALYDLSLDYAIERPLAIRGLVAGSPAYNAGFDYWTSATQPDGYTATGTISRDTSHPLLSPNAATLAASATLTTTAAMSRHLQAFVGSTVQLYFWGAAPSSATLQADILADGSSVANATITNNVGWELQTVEIDIASTVEKLQVKFSASGGSASVSDWWIVGGAIPMEYPLPTAIINGEPIAIAYAQDAEPTTAGEAAAIYNKVRLVPINNWRMATFREEAVDTEFGWLVFDGPQPPAGHRLYIDAYASLSVPTTDSGLIEVNAQEAAVVAKRAAVILLESLLGRVRNADFRTEISRRIGRLEADIRRLEPGLLQRPHAAVLPWQGLTSGKLRLQTTK